MGVFEFADLCVVLNYSFEVGANAIDFKDAEFSVYMRFSGVESRWLYTIC